MYVMRCLQRVFRQLMTWIKSVLSIYLTNTPATLERILVDEVRDNKNSQPDAASLGNRLNDIADQIDHLDNKVFNGVLLIGGLVALINPLAGAAIAVKAMIPSMGLFLAKYGLRYAGDSANDRDVQKQIKSAEKDVLQKFKEANTESLVNPLLTQFDRALETDEEAYDPLLEFDSMKDAFAERDRARLLSLSYEALTNTYADILNDSPHARQPAWSRGYSIPKMIKEIIGSK